MIDYRSLPYPGSLEKAWKDGVCLDMDYETYLEAKAKGFVFELVCPGCGLTLPPDEFVMYRGCYGCIEKND